MSNSVEYEDGSMSGAIAGAQPDLASVFQEHRERLKRMISLRLDSRLAGRIDASDILQETFLRAHAAYPEFLRQVEDTALPMFNWLRIQAQFAVGDCHRTHLGTQKRAAVREQHICTSDSMDGLAALAESMISPASQVARADLALQVRERIAAMDQMDREILILRHVEELSVVEAAAELGITLEAAKKRHLRAIRRLQELCFGMDRSAAQARMDQQK